MRETLKVRFQDGDQFECLTPVHFWGLKKDAKAHYIRKESQFNSLAVRPESALVSKTGAFRTLDLEGIFSDRARDEAIKRFELISVVDPRFNVRLKGGFDHRFPHLMMV